jgi:hypothetical protein
MLHLGRTSNAIGFFAVKNTVIIVSIAPTTFRILGMTSAGERADIFEDSMAY